jgi:hypothetical protein
MSVVLQHGQAQRGDHSVGVGTRYNIHLFCLERSIEQSQVHHAGRRCKPQSIGFRQSHKTIRPFKEFVSNAQAHSRCVRGKLGQFRNSRGPCILAAHGDGESVIESQ